MSQGTTCSCDESTKAPHHRAWEILAYKQNSSAFNGYHVTPSDYSAVRCTKCGRCWRTKANYVHHLPMAKPRQ